MKQKINKQSRFFKVISYILGIIIWVTVVLGFTALIKFLIKYLI
jgi:hypothetical protein